MKIAVIGGTGDMGYGIALRLGMAGHSVVIGSRDEVRAQEAAQRAFAQLNQTGDFTGLSNEDAAAQAELCIISVPAKGHRATLTSLREVLQGKMVLDITVPMSFGPLRYDPPQEGSNALETAAILGENARIAAGMHTVSATLLQEIEKYVEVYTSHKAVRITADGVMCLDQNGNEVLIRGTSVICALGQRATTDIADRLRGTAPFVRVIGDAFKVSTITNAVYMGYHAGLDV